MRSQTGVTASIEPTEGDVVGPRLWLLGGVIAVVAFLFAVERSPRELALAVVVGSGLMTYALMVSFRGDVNSSSESLRVESATAAIAGMGAALAAAFAASDATGAQRFFIVAAAALVVGSTALMPGSWRIGFLTPALSVIIATFGLTLWYLRTHPTGIDVEVVLREGVAGFLQSRNPYELTFTNPYTPEESKQFLAPGILVDNRISTGFPYPPVVLLLAIPGYLLGDVRISGLIALTAVAIAAHGRGGSAARRAAGLAFAFAPGSLFLITNAWTESLTLGFLMAAVMLARKGFYVTATVLLAAFLVSKQYLVVVLPCLWLLRGHASKRRLLVLVGTAILLLGPGAFADPFAFWRALSGGHMGDLIRFDSISLLVQGVATFGWDHPMLFAWLPLIAGISVATATALTFKPLPRSFLLSAGLSVMAAVLWSKQSFFNYYFFVGVVLAMAAFVGPRDFPEPGQRVFREQPDREIKPANQPF